MLKTFAYHQPSPDGLDRIARLREAFSYVKRVMNEECSGSREASVAHTHLETTAMWAIKAVVFNDPESVVET